MSGHEIVWTFDIDDVTARVVCHEEAGANCRLESYDGTCDCESWHIERDEKGPYHLYQSEDDEGNDIEVRHDMRDSSEGPYGATCNLSTWLTEGELFESAYERPTFEIARTSIEPVWNGDYYEWQVKSGG